TAASGTLRDRVRVQDGDGGRAGRRDSGGPSETERRPPRARSARWGARSEARGGAACAPDPCPPESRRPAQRPPAPAASRGRKKRGPGEPGPLVLDLFLRRYGQTGGSDRSAPLERRPSAAWPPAASGLWPAR